MPHVRQPSRADAGAPIGRPRLAPDSIVRAGWRRRKCLTAAPALDDGRRRGAATIQRQSGSADPDRLAVDRRGPGSRVRGTDAAELHDSDPVGAGLRVVVRGRGAAAGRAVAELPEVVGDSLAADVAEALEGRPKAAGLVREARNEAALPGV